MAIDRYNYGQSKCYKCGSAAYIKTYPHCIIGYDVYAVVCSNPECGNCTDTHMWRHDAVRAWSKKPTVYDRIVDFILEKIDKKK